MRKWLGVVVLVVLGVGAFLGWQAYQRDQLTKAVVLLVKGSSLRIAGVVETVTDPGNMSFAESFARAGDSLKSIDGSLVDVQTLDAAARPELAAAAVAYLKAGQNLVRSAEAVNRSLMKMSVASKGLKEAMAQMRATPGTGLAAELAVKAARRALDEVVLQEKAAGTAQDDARAALLAFARQKKYAEAVLGGDALVTDALLGKLEQYLQPKDMKSQ